MLKRGLIFTGFLFLAVVVCTQAEELLLSYYVFFPMLLLPLVFFSQEPFRRRLFPAAGFMAGVIFLSYLIRYPSPGMFVFGVGSVLFVFIFLVYCREWSTLLQIETRHCETALAELEALKKKHQSRLESLHHLEKQVAGLLDLFEIARDFNDCLGFKAMSEILGHKVMPELPFKRLRLILFEKVQEAYAVQQVFSVSANGIQEFPGPGSLSEEELAQIEKIRGSKRLLQADPQLFFPLISDGEMTASLVLEGTHPDDLAKFEVLAAYMTLQVKKVRLYETVKELSIRDGLTGVFIRRHFLERFQEELKRSVKYDLPLAVLMLDIDHFKRYNDEYGHLAGDATLRQVASLLRENLRKVDIVARYGGEEFVVVIPETRKTGALEVAERIRSNIARTNFKVYSDQTRVTVSVGIALFPQDVPNPASRSDFSELGAELIRNADQALYRAKEEGRNRVVSYQDV